MKMTDFEIDAVYNTICRPGRGGEDPHKRWERGECPYKGLEVLDNHQGI